MNGAEILEKVRALYLSLDSYQDAGTVETLGPGQEKLEFTTHFQRPLKFKFHWLSWYQKSGKSKPAKKYTIWSDGNHFKSDYHGKVEEEESFSLMMAGATGISRGSVHTIFYLLVPENHGLYYVWQDMTQIRSLPDEVVNGVECFHITGTNETTDDTEVWIEKATFFVRQMKETTVITEAKAEAISAATLEFLSIERMRADLEEANLPKEVIERSIAGLATPCKPCTYQTIYNYTDIIVNQPLVSTVFTG